MSTTKRRGRPKGSKNKKYVDAVSIPATCPACGSTKLTAVPGQPTGSMAHAGTLPGGFQYSSILFRRCRCECGQAVAVREYRK